MGRERILLHYYILIYYRRGNCKTKNLGMPCEVGLRKKTYNVLAGSVLTVWNQVEAVLTHDGNRRGANTKMQVSSINRLINDRDIIFLLISKNTYYLYSYVFLNLGGTTETSRRKENSRHINTFFSNDILTHSTNGRLWGIRGYRNNSLMHEDRF